MATFYRPVQTLIPGEIWKGHVSLISQADTDIIKTSITLANGDVQVSKDGGAFANLAGLPDEVGTSGLITLYLNASETAGITKAAIIKFHDVTGSEWQDCLLVIPAMQRASTLRSYRYAAKGLTKTALRRRIYGRR